jgi:hypothetical protein
MKQILLIIAMCVCALQSWAQSNQGVRSSGVVQMTDDVRFCIPATAVWVDVQVVETRTIVGPYARYAQKLLGLTVPVANKSQWQIADVKMNYKLCEFATDVEPLAVEPIVGEESSFLDENGFAKLGVDRMTSVVSTEKNMARDAAERIFEIRRCRYGLITGELGENVFGAGLEAALEELRTLENQLLEMFVGRRVVKTKTVRYVVDASRKSSIVCRFSEEAGLLPDGNLSGTPVVAKFIPVESDSVALSVPVKGAVDRFAVAPNMKVTVSSEQTIYAERIMPVFQQGYTIVEVPKSKR